VERVRDRSSLGKSSSNIFFADDMLVLDESAGSLKAGAVVAGSVTVLSRTPGLSEDKVVCVRVPAICEEEAVSCCSSLRLETAGGIVCDLSPFLGRDVIPGIAMPPAPKTGCTERLVDVCSKGISCCGACLLRRGPVARPPMNAASEIGCLSIVLDLFDGTFLRFERVSDESCDGERGDRGLCERSGAERTGVVERDAFSGCDTST
jgi:hypothetical protein